MHVTGFLVSGLKHYARLAGLEMMPRGKNEIRKCSGQMLTLIEITTRVWTPGGFATLSADPALTSLT